MAYRLALEMPDRIAAIAAVGGTLTKADALLMRAVPAIHFHGTADRIVPYAGPETKRPGRMNFLSVPATIQTWVKLTACPETPVIQEVPDQFKDGTRIRISTYGPRAGWGRSGAGGRDRRRPHLAGAAAGVFNHRQVPRGKSRPTK